jgi:hypothetical protein
LEEEEEEDSVMMDNWTKSYQVESGEVGMEEIHEEVFLFAEVFPFWLLVLNNTMHPKTKVLVYIRDEAFWLRRSLDLTLSYQVTSDWDEAKSWWTERERSKPRLVLLEGTSNFALDVGTVMAKTWISSERILFVCSGRIKHGGRLDLQWFAKSHSSFGGVTSTSFNIGMSNHFDIELWRRYNFSKCMRSVVEISKVDKGGIPCSDPTTTLVSENINTTRPIPATKLRGILPLPSVFNRTTGWVQRKLSVEEIALAMDLPVKAISTFVTNATISPSLVKPLTILPPVKVIQGCLIIVLYSHEFREATSVNPKNENNKGLSLSIYSPRVDTTWITEGDLKSVKRDDAVTQTGLWDAAALGTLGEEVLRDLHRSKDGEKAVAVIFKFLRKTMMIRFKLNVLRSGQRYLKLTYGEDYLAQMKESNPSSILTRDVEGIRTALSYSSATSFWAWDEGSFPLFWRWQPEVKLEMRDGTPQWIKGELPKFWKRQKAPKDPDTASKVAAKLHIPIAKRYISGGLVKSLTSYFNVPKGTDDIRMVYNLTACGLNEAIWAPSFWMPNVGHILDCATATSWFGDVDAAEMFLNYMLDIKIRPYAGVDLSWLPGDQNPLGARLGRWSRMPMGLLSSPWGTIRLFAWGMEIIKGDRFDKSNPFHWSTVKLNCPGTESYDPSLPRVYKWSDVYMAIAGDAKTFVDDLRSIGISESHCRAITHRVETMMGYLGLQDATRKRRPVSQSPGEWTGSIVRAIPGEGLFVTVSTKKWIKIKNILQDIRLSFASATDRPRIELKLLEQRVGFLVHVAMAYPMMFPFLKGFYLTMNSWREGRDEDDWKLPPAAFKVFLKENQGKESPLEFSLLGVGDERGPRYVTASTILFTHVESLLELFEGEEPTLRLVRGTAIFEVLYVFGDASGSGFGSSWSEAKRKKVSWRFGVWGVEDKGTSSNYKELRNLSDTLESMGEKNQLAGKEIFIFTDNMVSEAVVAKGSSQNSTLYSLVVRIIKLQMKNRCIIRFVHVAGTRMIDQGSDGLSRGSLHEGIMSGRSMLEFVPLHLPAADHSDIIRPWINSWVQEMGNEVEWLEPEGWFERGHDIHGSSVNADGVWTPGYKKGSFIWSPPPAAAGVVLDELRQARHKRQDSFHVFLCSRLLYPEWRRALYKSADMMFEIQAGSCSFWPNSAHETLVVALYFPYLNRAPWELRKAQLLVAMGRKMSKMFKTDEAAASHLLSEFCQTTRRMDCMPILNLRKMLSGQTRSPFSN